MMKQMRGMAFLLLLACASFSARAEGDARLLFGQGPAGGDRLREAELVAEANLGMLTTWYNGPGDLQWQRGYQKDFVPQAYASGYALHVITFTETPRGEAQDEQKLETVHGTACGRAYPLSADFQEDIAKVAEIWKGKAGDPPLYITLFTEFQTYPCRNNAWQPDEKTRNYYLALKDSYRKAASTLRRLAPNAQVSIGWGGWQAYPGNEAAGEGMHMLGHFADVMQESDFVSIQAMDSTGKNAQDILRMATLIRHYAPGKPVMVAHFKPDNGNQERFEADLRTILNDAYIRQLNGLGVFAFSFMDNANQRNNPAFYRDFMVPGIRKYGRGPVRQ